MGGGGAVVIENRGGPHLLFLGVQVNAKENHPKHPGIPAPSEPQKEARKTEKNSWNTHSFLTKDFPWLEKTNWPFFTQISGRNFLPEICGEVLPRTAPLQALRCALCSTAQSTFRGGEKGRKYIERKGRMRENRSAKENQNTKEDQGGSRTRGNSVPLSTSALSTSDA